VRSEIELSAAGLENGQGVFFKISRPGAEDSYLLGTLHLNDPQAANLPPPVLRVLDRARVLITEIADLPTVQSDGRNRLQLLVRDDEHRARRLLDKAEVADLERLLSRKGLRRRAWERLRPGVLALLLGLPPCDLSRSRRGTYAEAVLTRRAKSRGISIVGLESLQEQIDAFSDLPVEAEGAMLKAVSRQARRAEDIARTAIARYVAGDTGRLVAWMRSREPLPGDPASRLPSPFLDQLLDFRSRRMRDRLREHLKSGGAFIAVGAAHLPGKDGLIKLLVEDGNWIVKAE